MTAANLRVLGILALLLAGPLAAVAQDFRMDTEIYVDDDKKKPPASETLTIFKDGRVYDFVLTDPQEITIFDPQRGKFTLLDPVRKMKAEVATQDLLQFVLDLNTYS